MTPVTLNTSIASVLHITGIRHREEVEITIENNTGTWDGTYEMNIYKSKQKIVSIPEVAGDPITVTIEDIATEDSGNNKRMLLNLKPDAQNIDSGTHYYEVFNSVSKRIEFLGDLIIEK